MARQVIILVLVLTVLGIVMAEPPKASPGAGSSEASGTPAAESPDNIGPADDPAGEGDDVLEGPVGGPTPVSEYAAAATAPIGSSSGATALQISTGVGGAAAALAGFFF